MALRSATRSAFAGEKQTRATATQSAARRKANAVVVDTWRPTTRGFDIERSQQRLDVQRWRGLSDEDCPFDEVNLFSDTECHS